MLLFTEYQSVILHGRLRGQPAPTGIVGQSFTSSGPKAGRLAFADGVMVTYKSGDTSLTGRLAFADGVMDADRKCHPFPSRFRMQAFSP